MLWYTDKDLLKFRSMINEELGEEIRRYKDARLYGDKYTIIRELKSSYHNPTEFCEFLECRELLSPWGLWYRLMYHKKITEIPLYINYECGIVRSICHLRLELGR